MTEQPPLLAEALTLAEQVHSCVDTAGGDPAPLDAALTLARADTVAVAVVGETNRGKSSLLNALLAEELLPVDHRPATAVCVVVRHGDRRRALLEGAPDREIPLDEVAKWTTLLGGRQRRAAGALDAGPSRVDIETPNRLLTGGLQLVDTPGVDGITGVTAARDLGADALLVALDSAVRAAPEELDLLTAAAAVPAVAVLLTKIDASPDWADVRAVDAALIAHEVPSLAGVTLTGVSSRWHAEARRVDGDEAQELTGAAGFAPLNEWIAATQRRVRLLRGRELLETCRPLLGEALTDARLRRAAAAAADESLVRQLQERLEKLAAFATEAAEVRAIAEEERDRLFDRIAQRLDQRRNELERRLARIDRTGVRRQEDLGHELMALLGETDRELAGYAEEYGSAATRRGLEALVRLGFADLVVAYDATVAQPGAVAGIDPVLNPREVDIVTVIDGAKRIGAAIGVEAASKIAGEAGKVIATRIVAANPVVAAFGALAVLTPVAVGSYVEARRETVRTALADKVIESSAILKELEVGWHYALERQIDDLWRALNEEARRRAERTAEYLELATTARDHDAARLAMEDRLARQTAGRAEELLSRVEAALVNVNAALAALC